MKHLKKIAAVVVVLALALTLFACGSTDNDKDVNKNEKKDNLTIGILQFGSHPSLDNCYQGVVEGLSERGYVDGSTVTLDHQLGNFESETCDSIAKNMVSKNYDMIIAIATPAAVSAYAAAQGTEIPVIFCAVSDPVEAKLVESLEKPGTNTTGTSDILDFAAQLDLITTLQPDAKDIGVLYTTSEANSVSQLAEFKRVAAEYGVNVVEQGIQSAADVPQAAAALAAKVDCINNFTDNNVVNNLSVLIEQANAAGIPVYGSEIEQVVNGCIASMSIEYIALGNVTANMAADVLAGQDIKEMGVRTITDATPVVNTEVLDLFNITLPEKFANAEKVKIGEGGTANS